MARPKIAKEIRKWSRTFAMNDRDYVEFLEVPGKSNGDRILYLLREWKNAKQGAQYGPKA